MKNWSVIYRDGKTPSLAPAYDIVCTLQYAPSSDAALDLARVKSFYAVDEEVWRRFARRVELAERRSLERSAVLQLELHAAVDLAPR
jgi:serine/threonine-protein kinase HipA